MPFTILVSVSVAFIAIAIAVLFYTGLGTAVIKRMAISYKLRVYKQKNRAEKAKRDAEFRSNADVVKSVNVNASQGGGDVDLTGLALWGGRLVAGASNGIVHLLSSLDRDQNPISITIKQSGASSDAEPEPVTSVCGGNQPLVVGTDSGGVYVYNKQCQLQRSLRIRPEGGSGKGVVGVRCIAVSPKGTIYCGCDDDTIRVWGQDGTEDVWKGHGGWVTAIVVHPQTGSVFSGSMDQTVRLWADGHCLDVQRDGSLLGVTALALAKDNVLVSAHSNGCVNVWDISAGCLGLSRRSPPARAHTLPVTAVVVAGTTIISAADMEVKAWDWSGSGSGSASKTFDCLTSPVAGLALVKRSPIKLVCACRDGTICELAM